MKRWTNVWLCQRALKKNLESPMMITTVKIHQLRCSQTNFHRIKTLMEKRMVMKKTKNAEPKRRDRPRSKECCMSSSVRDVTILFLVSSVLLCTLRKTRKNSQLCLEPLDKISRRLYLNSTNSVKDNIPVSTEETIPLSLNSMVPRQLRIWESTSHSRRLATTDLAKIWRIAFS